MMHAPAKRTQAPSKRSPLSASSEFFDLERSEQSALSPSIFSAGGNNSLATRTEKGLALADPLTEVHEFCEANTELLGTRCYDLIEHGAGSKPIEEAIQSVNEKGKAIVKGLQALGQVHPFVGVAVGAFVLVVTMDMTRRENDRKVVVVRMKMQEMIMVFFELRHVKSSSDRGSDGITVLDRLLPVMQQIAKDIKACGSACDAYVKKGFLMKTVKAGTYENRLSEFCNVFDDHRRTVELAMSVHISLGVDAANDKLDDQHHRLKDIERKIDMLAFFRKFDTPREKDIHRFIDSHGGAKACISNDEALEELVLRSGELSVARISGKDTGRKSNDLPQLRKRLFKELQEDVDELFSRNMVLFERKLEMQNKQLTDALHQESSHIISTLLSGAHDRIIDPDLQKIWKDMGWKGSVKARHFVLALHDYYTDRANQQQSARRFTSSVDRLSTSPLSSSPKSPSRPSSAKSPSTAMTFKQRQDDQWALAYINAAYVQPILEAVDDDGTGFVSVKEVNTFVESRPEGWSLPTWIAFWAVGWQASISKYKGQIYTLIQTMFQVLEHVLPSNRRAIDEYLFHASFWRIELLLRSTRSINFKVMTDPDLARFTEAYSTAEEERIDANLKDVAYELDTPATVSLVTGEGRIERYIFPLLYLLLKRHLKVLKLACQHVLDTEELASLNESLVSALLSVDDRIQNLEAVFKQTHLDVQGRFGNFAFGLFQLSYGDIRRVPIQNTLGTWADEDDNTASGNEPLTLDTIKSSLKYIPRDILKYGIQDAFQATNYYEFEPHRLRSCPNPIQGTWTGHCSRKDGEESVTFLLRISFRLSPDRKTLLGKGEDYASTFNFAGTTCRGRGGYEFTFALTDDDGGLCRTCTGTLSMGSDTITAAWSDRRKKDNPDEVDYLPFTLRRTPPYLYRYRPTPHEFSEDPVRSRWAFACNAVLHEVQAKMWSREFFERRFGDRKRFVELSTRDLIVSMGLTPQNPLSSAEKQELDFLRRDLDPSEARFYHALATFEIQKLPWHPAWGCDWCERRITKCRIMCLECIADDLSDNIDLCSVCMDKMPTKRGFSHDVSHAMVKVEQTLHDFHFSRVVEGAKSALERAKGLLRNVEAASRSEDPSSFVLMSPRGSRGSGSSKDPADIKDLIACACCSKTVTTPCWACVICTRDTFVCHECDLKRLPALANGPSPGHTQAHALVRIRDSSIAGQNASTEEKLAALQQRLVNLEHKVADGLSAIDNKVEERLARLEAKMEHRFSTFEETAERRFDTLEALLRMVAAQTSALPSIYGQVVRDHVQSIYVKR
ncbi:hypothetical protein D9611_010859 [Ephemerocybe angulata]|uniref:EF-hand domain-containing protein n=1 Tax=Ephemerocybe angulata TaxID=980116 RepID=A0A8H5C4K1_9AGAR|nr:hypothetical protein D9611_010859 [Tulosesus angulatus]